MFASKSTIVLAFLAIAQIASATTPACLLAAVNTESDPSDLTTICGKDSSKVKAQISSKCDSYLAAAMTAYSSVCSGPLQLQLEVDLQVQQVLVPALKLLGQATTTAQVALLIIRRPTMMLLASAQRLLLLREYIRRLLEMNYPANNFSASGTGLVTGTISPSAGFSSSSNGTVSSATISGTAATGSSGSGSSSTATGSSSSSSALATGGAVQMQLTSFAAAVVAIAGLAVAL
ncbi:MAG: hypothetical protein M1834_004506 [Cirrosporium novae-zelandiae]|nr:MAG: hypothetical protein M1834_004506 [Cirrosporium novae-zelandiae]